MVIGNPVFEEQIQKRLSEAKSELGILDDEMLKLQNKRSVIAQEVQAYETILQSFLRRSGKQVNLEVDWKQLLADAETHKDRLKLIAKHNGGVVKVSQAADILYTNGLINSKRRANAYQIVQNNLASLAEEGVMEKSQPGEYRLIGSQQSLPILKIPST